MGLRACERIDPRAVYGKSWMRLSWCEQVELIAFDIQRRVEESPPEPEE